MPDALPPATPSEFAPIDFGTWSSTPEAARIADPLERIQAYDNRTRKDLFKAGLYDAEAESEIVNAGADQALRAGLIADPAEYAPAAKPRDPNFLARQLVRQGDTAKAQDIYRYQSFLGRPDTDPETLERARIAAEVDPDTENELTRKAVRAGELPFAVVPDKDGNAIFEIDPELGALDRQQILDLAGDDFDPRFLPDLEKQLTRVEGTNYTPAQFRQAGVFDGFLKNQIKEDPFLGDVLERAQTEYDRTGQISEEVTGELDRTFAALDADNEFAPSTRSRLIRDTIKRASKPEGYDPENPQQHVQYLEDGTVWLPEQVIFDQAKHDQVLDSLSVTPEQKEAAKKLRAGRLESIAPAMVDAMGANPDALDFFEKSKAAGKSDVDIATEYYSKPENYSFIGNRARSFGMSLIEAGPGLFQSVAALAGSESAREALQARAQDTARNEEYARLFGDSYGVGQSLLNTSSQVAVDLLAGLAVSAVATPVAGAAVAGSRTAASSLVRGLARTAISGGARSTAAGFLRSGAGSAARTLATMGDDVAAGLARSIGGQTGVAASSFTRSAGSAYVQAYSALDAQTNPAGQPMFSDEEKRKIALGTAITAGASTAAITLGFGKILGGGVEDFVTGKIGTGILKRVYGATDDQIVAATRTSALAILKSAGAEAPEEAADQLVGNVIQSLGTGEEFRLGPALKEALEAGLVGGLLGAGTKSIEIGIDKFRSPKVVALENANAPASAAALEAKLGTEANAPADPTADLKQAAVEVGMRVTELKAQVQELSGDPVKNKGKIERAKKRLAEATAEKTRLDFAAKNPETIRVPAAAPTGVAGAEARAAGPQPTPTAAASTPTTPNTGKVSYADAVASLKSKGVDVKTLSREDFADAMASEGHNISDTQLRKSRSLRDTENRIGKLDLKHLTKPLDDLADSIKTGARKIAGVRFGDATAGWVHYHVGSGTRSASGAKVSTQTPKAYITIKEGALDKAFSPANIEAFLAELGASGINGQVKHASSGTALASFDDQVVFHGATKADADAAAKLSEKFFGADIEQTTVGVDAQWGSYSQVVQARANIRARGEFMVERGRLTQAEYEAKMNKAVADGELQGSWVPSTTFVGGLDFVATGILDPDSGSMVTGSTPAAAAPTAPTPAAAPRDRRAGALTRVLTNKGVSDGPAIRFAEAFARNLSPDTTLEDARGQILDAFRSAGGIFADETADTAAIRANPQTWVDAGYTPEESQKFAELAAAEIEAAQEAADAANEAIVIPEPTPAAAQTPAPAAATSVEQLDPESFIAEFRAERPSSKESDAEIRARQARMISTAILGRDSDGRGPRPVSAAAARAYGIDAPAGWTETGGLLVPPTVPEDIIGTDQAPEPPDVEPGEGELDYGDGSELTVQDNPLGGPAPKPQTTKATKFSRKARALVERMLTPESRTQPPEFLQQQKAFTPTQTTIQSRIAALYEAMPVDDSANPEVVKAYQNLVTEVVAQYRAMLGTGIRIEMGSENPYATSGDMIDDVERGRLWIYKTEPGSYGSDAMLNAGNHPMLAPTEFTDLNGEPMLANDVFRAVHDYVAHAAFGFSFGPLGEEAAWKAHLSTLRDPLARLALTTETRGQNSWVNYRPEMLRDGMPIKKGEPGYVAPQDRPFATQKFALLPEEAMTLVPIAAAKRGKTPKTKKPTEKQIAAEMRAGTPLAVHETLFNDTISQGWVPTRNVLLNRLAEAGFGGQVYGTAFVEAATARIRALYPLVEVPKTAETKTLKSLGLGDIKGKGNKLVSIPVFADGKTAPFTNDPVVTSWQKAAGLSVKIPEGIKVNPAIGVNSRNGFVSFAINAEGVKIFSKGDSKRAGNVVGDYVAAQNKEPYGRSLETLPPVDTSVLAGRVDFAGFEIIPGETTEDDILRYFLAPSNSGRPSLIEQAVEARAPKSFTADQKESVRSAAQLAFLRELREFTLDVNSLGSVNPEGFGHKDTESYKAYLEGRAARVWTRAGTAKDGSVDTSTHWNSRGRPTHLSLFVDTAIKAQVAAAKIRPDATVRLGSDDVDQATALERAAARNDADGPDEIIAALDEAFDPDTLRGIGRLAGREGDPVPTIASSIADLITKIDGNPKLRSAINTALVSTHVSPLGSPARVRFAALVKGLPASEILILAGQTAFTRQQLSNISGLFKSLAPGLNTFPDKPKPKRPDVVVKMPVAPVLAAPTPAPAPTPAARQRGTGGGELQVQDNTLGAPDFAPTPMRQRGTGGGELQVQDNTLGAPEFAPAPATEPSPPMVYEGGALVPQDNTLAGQEWENTPVSHTVAATSEQSLTPEEKTTAAEALGFPTWTPEARTSFVTRFTDWFASGGKLAVGALLPLFNKVRIIIAAGTLAMTSMISINDATPRDIRSISPAKIAEAVAAPKVKQAAAPAKRAAPVQRLVDFDGVSASSNVRVMAQWVLNTKDSDGQPFVVAEKVAGVIYVFSGDGVLIKKAPALFGATPGDIQTQEQRDLTIEQRRTTKAAQVTEAGRFPSVISNTGDSYGDTAVFNPYKHTISALHIPYLGRPAENRLGRMASPTAEDNRISLGCVNIPADAMSAVASQFKDGGIIYILPETEAGKQLYPGFANLDIPSEMPATGPDMAARSRMDSVAYLDQATIPTIREDNRAAIADLQLGGDLRSAIERIARSAKYPRRYRAVMLAALKMQVLPNISIVDAPAEAYAGSYTHSARLITLNIASSNGRGMLDVLAHELLHAATLEAIANPQTKAAKELLARLERARQKAAEVVPSDMSYAVSSIDEFITHAATDPRLQVILRETFEKGKTTWQRVVDAIAKFFGIANPDFVSDLWGFINHAAEYGLRPGVAASREQRSMPGTDWSRRDAEYLAAVESGDLETAQRMVDAAARDAGYTLPVKHATPFSFTEFSRQFIAKSDPDSEVRGFHLSNKADEFSAYVSPPRVEGVTRQRRPRTEVLDLFVRPGRTIGRRDAERMVRAQLRENPESDAASFPAGYDTVVFLTGSGTPTAEQRAAYARGEVVELADGYSVVESSFVGVDGSTYTSADLFRTDDPGQIITGYLDLDDAFEMNNESHVVVRDPNQIKSADPVTRDDAGNVIPLSARFRPSSPDIRFSLPAPAPAAEPASTLLEDTKAKTVAGTTVGTRNPTSKTAAESGTDPKALVDRASMRRDPELYRKNAVMLADFPLVAGQVPEAAQMVRAIKAPVIKAQAEFDAASAKLEKTRAELKAELARRAGVRATAIKVAEVDKLEAGETKIARGDTAIRGMLRNIEQARKAQEKARDKRTAAGEVFKAASKTLMAGDRFPIELADRVYDAIETAAIRNLELLIELFPAALRDTARLWYDGANIIAQEFASQFGTTLNRSSAVLAVFSPQKDWFMNVALAKRMMKVWANHQNTPFDGEMAAQYLKRAGEPEPIWDKKANDFKRDTEGNITYTKGAKPVLDDEGNITGWTNWSAESAREKFKKAEEDLAAMRGKTLAELPIEFQARFIRMWSEIYDSANFPIVSPDGSFGDNKLSEKGNPQRIAWGSYVTIEKAIAIMTAPEADEMQVISDELGVQHKVRSFYNNIVDPANTDGHVTMDTHAIAAILWQALSGNSPEVTMNFGGGGASGSSNLGVSGLYPAFAEAYRKVAEKFGLLPREIQSITWESVRLLFPAKFKSQKANVEKVREIWRMHELNLLTTQQAHDRIFQIVDEWKRRSTLAGQPGRTAAEAVADGTGVGDPDWAEIARRGQNNSGAPPVAPDAGGLPAGGRRGNGAGRPAVGRRGAGRDAGLLPGSAAGDQPGSVLGALTPEGAAPDGSRGSVDQFLPTLPAGVSYSFDDTRPKYLAFARRSQPGVVTINKQALAAVIAGLSPANARAIVSKIVKHEIAHLAAFSTFTDADIAEMARGMSAHEINEVARRYYDSPDALARLDADLESGAITNEAIVEEYLRMQLELATDGSTTEATIAFHSNNPGFVARMVKYLKDALVALWRNVAGPQEDFVNRVAISRLAREYRAILRGHKPLRAEPFDPADPNRDTRAALAPQSNTDPDADAAIREIFTESVEDFTRPYEPGSLWRRLFVVRTGDRRFPAISDKRQSSLTANELLVYGRRDLLKKSIKAENPDAQVLAAAAGDTSPTTTPEQDAYIAEEFAAAMEDARGVEDPAEQATAVAEAYALKQRLTTAAYVETARIKKRRIDEAFAELERTAPKTAANLKAMREGIDNISRIVKEYQPDASPLRMVLGTQEGIYLTRVYKIHHKDGDPLSIFSDPAMADVRERAQDQLMESFIQYRTAEIIEQEAEAGKIIGETEARDIALAEAAEQDLGRILLEDYLLSHGSKALPHNGSDFRTDLTRFFKKMPVPEALRDVLEEVTDPVELLTRTGLNVGMLAASTVFTRDLARGGYTSGAMVTGQQRASYRKLIQEPDTDKYLAMLVDNGWAKRVTAPGFVEVAPDVHIPAWLVKAKEERDLTYVENFRKVSTTTKTADAGKLADLYAHPNVADWMDHVFAKNKAVTLDDAKLVQKMGEVFAKATGTSLGIATLGSVGFYSRNLVGTAFFLAANGINPFSAKSMRASKLAVEAFLNRESGEVTKLTGLGVFNDDLRPETIKELLKGETDRPGGLNILELMGRVLGGKKGIEYGTKTTAGLAKLAELATAIDGIAKGTAYYAELETMREAYPDKSAKWHEDEAAKIVKLTHQAKSQTPPIIDSLTSSSYGRLMSPYLRFKGEMFRLTGNIIAQSAAEIRSDNPAIRARGYRRAAGFAMISAFSVAGPALISAMYGVGDDEEYALRKALPSYLRGNSIIYIPSDDGKSVTSLDFTYLNPYSFIGDPISRMGRAVMRGEPGDGVDELAIWMNSSFLSEQILAGAAMEVLRNKTSDDKPITFETDSADEKLIKFSKHLVGSSFTPQSLKAIQRSYDTARRGTPEDTPFFETAPGIIIGHGMPIRPRAFETEALALRAARSQAETNRQVRALAGQLKRRINFSEGDIQDIVADLQDSTASLNVDIARMIAGYRGLGLDDAAIAKQLVESGRSREFARAIVFRGVAAGPAITPATRRDMFEAGEKAGGAGGGERRVKAVAEAMRRYEKVQQVRGPASEG